MNVYLGMSDDRGSITVRYYEGGPNVQLMSVENCILFRCPCGETLSVVRRGTCPKCKREYTLQQTLFVRRP